MKELMELRRRLHKEQMKVRRVRADRLEKEYVERLEEDAERLLSRVRKAHNR